MYTFTPKSHFSDNGKQTHTDLPRPLMLTKSDLPGSPKPVLPLLNLGDVIAVTFLLANPKMKTKGRWVLTLRVLKTLSLSEVTQRVASLCPYLAPLFWHRVELSKVSVQSLNHRHWSATTLALPGTWGTMEEGTSLSEAHFRWSQAGMRATDHPLPLVNNPDGGSDCRKLVDVLNAQWVFKGDPSDPQALLKDDVPALALMRAWKRSGVLGLEHWSVNLIDKALFMGLVRPD